MNTPSDTIAVAKPLMDEREIEAVSRVIRSGWVTQGPEVAALEREFSAFVGSRHACAVSNCTTALHLALRGAGVGPGDEVITVSHSFIATANAVRYCGAVPVFVDIERTGYNIDPELIEGALSARTKAILVVHQLGMPCDLTRLVDLARRHSIRLIEDAACAIGSEVNLGDGWQKIGSPHGDIACFSFHPRKVVTTGDGGMLTTNDADLDKKFRLWRQHAMSVSDTARHASQRVIFESYTDLGYNYRMTDLQAAIGREQLVKLPDIVARRREIAGYYSRALAGVAGVTPPMEPEWARSNWQSYCITLDPYLGQTEFMQDLLDMGISSRRGVMNIHLEPAYDGGGGSCIRSDLTRSEAAQTRSVILPLFAQMTGEECERVLAGVRHAVDRQTRKKASRVA
jgi:dTDP-4-amino-4,6-dideoxygalactose transaminase